ALAVCGDPASVVWDVYHQCQADPRSDRQEDEVVHVAAETMGTLGERREVDVVFEADVGPQFLADGLDEARAAPPGKVGRHRSVAVRRVEDSGAADRRGGPLRPLHAGPGPEPAGEGAARPGRPFAPLAPAGPALPGGL